MESLPASDAKRKLVQTKVGDQRQQDTHEFLNQLLDQLGSNHATGPSREQPVDHKTLERLESEFSDAMATSRRPSQNGAAISRAYREHVWNLAFEYITLHWHSSFTRMTEVLGSIFEGQRLATMQCSSCNRTGFSGAEPFS